MQTLGLQGILTPQVYKHRDVEGKTFVSLFHIFTSATYAMLIGADFRFEVPGQSSVGQS